MPFLRCLAAFLSFAVARADDTASEARFVTNARQLIYEGRRSGEGYFHPDGNSLVFQSEREEGNPFYQIYLLDLLSGDTARVSPGKGKTTCAFFQPGTNRVLFASTHHDPQTHAKQNAELELRASGKQRRYAWDYDDQMDIFSCQRDGTQMARLTDAPGYDAEASFSPDGRKIVFCSLRSAFENGGPEKLPVNERKRYETDAASFGEIYIMNLDGSQQQRLTHAPGYDGGPFFSPDGERIIWRRFDEKGMNADVYTMKIDGSDVRRLTDFQSMSWAPFYHPSAEYVIFTSNTLGFENFELFLVDARGEKEPIRVTFTPGFDGLPVFSPQGDRLCWTANRTGDGKSQLFLADWNHDAALQALAAAPGRKLEPSSRPLTSDRADASRGAATRAQLSAEIASADLQAQVEWLAAPERDGRRTGTLGATAAAKWLADSFARIGLKKLGESFFQPFEFNAGVKLIAGENRLVIDRTSGDAAPAQPIGTALPAAFAVDQDFRPIPFSDSGEVEGEVIFAGYGLSVPEGGGARYNSYDGVDVKDKIVLLLRYVPEAVDPQRRAQLNRYAGLRYKAMLARERGAKAVLFVSGPNSAHPGELIPLAGDGSLAGSGVIAASISAPTANAILAAAGKDLKALQTGLDNENPHAEASVAVPKLVLKLVTAVERIKKTDRNVVGYLPPIGTDEYVIAGAHYDHLGRGDGNSMARSGEEGQVHPGADDNASGVALVIELAANLAEGSNSEAATRDSSRAPVFRRGIIFALWSGEEMGLLGSSAFCANPPVELAKVAAYINFDMVGRLHDNKLTLQGVGSSKLWRKLIEKRNVAAGFQLVLQDDPYLPTDVTSFYPKRVPVLNFFTGAHEDYHRPSDIAAKINYTGIERITKFARALVLDVASAPERPDLARVERSDAGRGSRETLRAYLGTIPDYTAEVKGVKISGVRGGSPAEKGGIKGGDVILELAGQKIANIYDYTYALDAVKIGAPVKILVARESERLTLTVTPEARK